MKKLALFTTTILLVSALTACTTTQMSKPTHHHPVKAHHHDHDHAHWDYKSPEKWGDLEVNKLCTAGQQQSPINVNAVTKAPKGKFNLQGNYTAQDFTIQNNGHTIVFNAKDPKKSTLKVNGTTYELLQFHYHVPSEHTVMNAFYPLEIHFVHKNASGNLAVVGVLVDKGQENKDFGKILTDLPVNDKKDGLLSNFNVETLMPKNSPTYAYDGSLTTPPCSEQVQWLLKSKPIHASVAQLKVLSALYDGNNRPVQPQGNRTISLVE